MLVLARRNSCNLSNIENRTLAAICACFRFFELVQNVQACISQCTVLMNWVNCIFRYTICSQDAYTFE